MGDNHIRRKHWTLCSPRNVHECDLPPDAQTGADQVRYQLDQRIQVFLLLCRQSVNEQVVFSVPVDLPDLGGDLGHAAQHALYRGPEPRDLTAEHNLHSEQHNLHLHRPPGGARDVAVDQRGHLGLQLLQISTHRVMNCSHV